MPPLSAAFSCNAALPIPVSTRPQVIRQPVTLSSFRPFTKQSHLLSGRPTSPRALPVSRPISRSTRLKSVTVRSQNDDQQSFLDAARDAASGKPGLQSDTLESKVRRRAEDAIQTRGGRVTVGDVASTSGLTIFEAESALKALAADSLATLAVSNEGEILYCFPTDFRNAIRNRSWKTRFESFAAATNEITGYLVRVLYGTALISSIAIVTTALLVIASSSRDDRNRGRGGGGGGLSFNYYGTRAMFDLTDYLFFYDPYYYRRRRMAMYRGESRNSWNFVEAVFSFVFGDGDPNVAYEEKKWEIVGKYIASKGGVVTAEQLAPFMDVNMDQIKGTKSNRKRNQSGVVVDESYVLPALTRFKGSPEVDADGHIVYVFPALQTTADARKQKEWFNKKKKDFAAAASPAAVEEVLESPWKLTGVIGGQLGSVVALGIANLVGVLWLSNALTAPANAYALAMNGLGWIFGAMPYLQIYAISFFIIPAVRWVLYQGRNQAIASRNEAKMAAQKQLMDPSAELLQKMAAAAVLAQQNLVTKETSVFRSDKDIEQQPIDVEADVWERKLERRASERELDQRGWIPAPKRDSVQSKKKEERW